MEKSYQRYLDFDSQYSDREIEQLVDNAIKNSSAFIILLGLCKSQKEANWINKEIEIAQKYKKPILTIKDGENEIPAKINETTNKFINWEKQLIIEGIKEILGIK